MFCNVASASHTETEGTRGDPGFMSCVETKRQQSFTKLGRVLLKLLCHLRTKLRESWTKLIKYWRCGTESQVGRPSQTWDGNSFANRCENTLDVGSEGVTIRVEISAPCRTVEFFYIKMGKPFLYGGKAGRWPELQSFLHAVSFNNRSESRWDDLLR